MITKRTCMNVPKIIFIGTYIYLALPVILFLVGWLKLPLGIPAAALVAVGVFRCYREHDFKEIGYVELTKPDLVKCFFLFFLIVFWVVFSGIGKYVWQNSDHYVRNEIFNVITEGTWPIYSSTPEKIPLVYYIGYWLPSAVIGKLFGLRAGYFAQAAWAVVGISLCYGLICLKRKKVSVWPLLLFMFFSGLDIIGTTLAYEEGVPIFGSFHMESWSHCYQFSSMTTQLFWVFNQALPAWLACLLVFLYEKPKNMFFTLSLLLLTSSFPFVGLVPFAVYFMVKRTGWQEKYKHVNYLIVNIWRNWASIQNILVSLVVLFFCGLYLTGNDSLSGTVSLFFTQDGTFRIGIFLIVVAGGLAGFAVVAELLVKGYKKMVCVVGILLLAAVFIRLLTLDGTAQWWWTDPFEWVNLTLFYFLEAGVFLLVLHPLVKDKALFWLNAVFLYLIPLIRVGYSIDFCMRVSIPGLLLIIVWCIDAFDGFKASGSQKMKITLGLLALLLAVGAVTPFHEFKRTYTNTLSYYERITISEEELFQGTNFSGNPDSFFWKYLSK